MNLQESYRRLFKSRSSSNDALLLSENVQAKELFIDIMTAAQRQGKFEEIVQLLDEEYGIFFTDDAAISQKDLYSAINRADFSVLSSQDLSSITKDVKRIIKI
jgi:hypothetical protein